MDLRYRSDQPVSVALVCHNKASALPRIIDALARGTHRPDRIVLSDDASTDGSREVFRELCGEHGLDGVVVEHDGGGGRFRINTMRNDGIRTCEDGLVIVLDADLVPSRTCVEAHRDVHRTNDDPVVSTGPRLEYAFADGSGPVDFMWGFESLGLMSAPANAAHPELPCWQVAPGSQMGMTRAAVESLGWFDPQYDGEYGFDDVDFMYRAHQRGFRFIGVWEAHVIHLPHPPALGHRDGRPNQQRFERKYGTTMTYPEAILKLARDQPWSEWYRDLSGEGLSRLATRSVDIDRMHWRELVGSLARRVRRRLGLG